MAAKSCKCVHLHFIYIISAILTNAINSNTEDDAVDIEMQSDMMLILSGLCDGDMHRKVNLVLNIVCLIFIGFKF